MNWLITGGCGFIGTNLVHRLTQQGGHDIRILDNLVRRHQGRPRRTLPTYTEPASHHHHGPPTGVELIVGDILDPDLALTVTTGIDAIVHLAGNTGVQPSIDNPRLDCTANVIGTLNYLEAARHHHTPRFVFASSGGTVIGDAEPPIHEDMVPHPKSPYGASKSACEGYLSAYHGTYGIHTVALRFANVYGPRSTHKNSVVARFIRQALHRQPLEIYGDGNQSRDFIYIDDLTHAIHNAATQPDIGGETFQIATSHETTINEFAHTLLPILEAHDIPTPTVTHTNPLPGEIRRNYSDTTKARTRLDWQATTPLDEGLKRTLAWFLQASMFLAAARSTMRDAV